VDLSVRPARKAVKCANVAKPGPYVNMGDDPGGLDGAARVPPFTPTISKG
jgi:hypothetical protein